MSAAADYWAGRYTDPQGIEHHSRQNATISRDFLAHVAARRKFDEAFRQARSVLEIGCGTGELAAMIAHWYGPQIMLGTDFSPQAVAQAQRRHAARGLQFQCFDVLNGWPTPLGGYDLAVSSNTLEHFKDPWLIIGRMLLLAARAVVLVPYRQPVTDGYDAEGGAGHAQCFSLKTFSHYRIVDSFTFETAGWQHRSGNERPLQLAVLLQHKRSR